MTRRAAAVSVAMVAACVVAASPALALTPSTSIDAVTITGPETIHVDGSVNPNGEATTGRFEYGRGDSAFCTPFSAGAPEGVTVDQDLGTGADAVAVTANISGLAPGASYCIKLVGHNASGDGASFNYFTAGAAEPVDGGGNAGGGDPVTPTTPADPAATAPSDPPPGPSVESPPATSTPAPTVSTRPLTPTPAAARCVVPKLIGLTPARAKKALAKAHCGVGKVTKKAARAQKGKKAPKKGTVTAQSPRAGTKKPAGSKVALTLAT